MNARKTLLKTTVAEFLDTYPAAVPVFLNYHLACVGCAMSGFDTLKDVVRIYHLPADQFLADLDQTLQSSTSPV